VRGAIRYREPLPRKTRDMASGLANRAFGLLAFGVGAQARIHVLDQAMASRRGVLDEVMRNFSERPDTTLTGSHGSSLADPTDWLQINPNGGWMIKPGVIAQFDAEVNAARQRFIEARRKTFGGGARRAGQEALGRYAARLELMKEAQAVLEAELREAVSARVEAARTARVLADNALAPTVALAAQAMGRLPATMQPWSSSAWDTWAPCTAIPGVDHVLAGWPMQIRENCNSASTTPSDSASQLRSCSTWRSTTLPRSAARFGHHRGILRLAWRC
jgi:hypothetical protein